MRINRREADAAIAEIVEERPALIAANRRHGSADARQRLEGLGLGEVLQRIGEGLGARCANGIEASLETAVLCSRWHGLSCYIVPDNCGAWRLRVQSARKCVGSRGEQENCRS